jgi:DNA-binding CsgD family transcriptional regulator
MLGFRHVLIETAAYQDLLASQRRRLHRAYAELLERQVLTAPDPFRLAELARHWDEADEATRALAASIRAASAADSSYQPALANEQYERALRLIGALPAGALDPSLDRVELFERAARSAAGTGSPRSIDHILGAIELVDATSDPVRAGLLHERLGRYRWYSADGDGALAAYTEAVRLVPAEPPSAARARVTAGLAQLLMILARFDESMQYCQEALANASAINDLAIESHVMNTLGVNKAYLGDVDGGLELLWSSKEIAERLGSVEDVGRAYANLVDVLLTGGRYEEAADLGLSSWKYQLEHGLVSVYGGAVLTYAAWALHILARWPEAIAALELAAQYPIDANSRVHMLAVRAMVEACRGELDQAAAHLDMARPHIAHAIDTQLILPFSEADAEVAIGAGRPGDALEAVVAGIARSEPVIGGTIKRFGPLYAVGMRAAGDLVAQPDIDESVAAEARRVARDLMSAMIDVHRQIGADHTGHLRVAEPYLALCQAEQTRVLRASDPDAWDAAAQSLARLGGPYLHAYALWRLAQADLALHGRTEQTERPLREAHRLALEIGAQPLLASIEDLARRARVALAAKPRDEAAAGARFGLTEREMEVLALVARGKTNHEIGEQLFISAKTASVHVSNVLAKLGAARRSEAAAVAARMGLGSGSDGDIPTAPDEPRRN